MNLAATKTTDDGLKQLEGLTQLKSLNVVGTKVTRRGYERFRLVRPDVGISYFGDWHKLLQVP